MIIPSGEKIIETKRCLLSGVEFVVTDKDGEFYDKISPIFGGKKYAIPSPTLCPDERQKRRLAFRNERKLYKRKCNKTGQDIISIYSPDKPYVVYGQKVWWGDDWSPMDYGRNFDFEKGFFEQFQELGRLVPTPNIHVLGNENSDYVNQCGYTKDSYMCFNTDFSEKCLYTTNQYKSRDCVDCFMGEGNEKSYQLIDSSHCYSCKYLFGCITCRDSAYLRNCISCSNCFGCTNLINKSYCIFNTQYSQAEYQKKIQSLSCNLSFINFIRFLKEASVIVRPNIVNSEHCIGDNIRNSKDIFSGFDIESAENICYASIFSHGKDCTDYDIGGYQSELCYELVSSGDKNFSCAFSTNIWSDTSHIFYSDMIKSSNNLFGCIRIMKKGSHCILNTPYSVQEYETLCGKIIDHMRSTGEWGEFFPHHLSPFGYNETVANEYFPLSPGQGGWYEVPGGLKKGDLSVNWHTEEEKRFEGNVYQPLPISQYDERVVGFDTATKNINECLSGIIQCEVTKKPFKIIKQELAFYIENGIPIPTKHPDQRHKERMDLRNPRTLYERTCSECHQDITTTYAPERPEKVVCEECYRNLVY